MTPPPAQGAPPPLRVAVDATPLLGERTGVGEFCAGALAGLAARDDVRVCAFAVSWRRRHGIEGALPPGVQAVRRPLPARPVQLAWRHSRFPPIEWVAGRVDVVHGTNFVVPPARSAGRVVTVHDLTAVRFPELCDPPSLAFPALVRRAVGEGAFVHTPSQFVAEEVVEHFGAPPERVRAVAHGVPEVSESAVRRGVVPPAPYVLAVGTIEPRKDFPRLVRAFDAVAGAHPELLLVVVGRAGWGARSFEETVEASAFRQRILRPGYVTAAERIALMAGARVFCYPSVYEGFGLPPLEAMALGVPVVATAAGAVPEVVGDAAELVAPGDTAALAAALQRAVEDEDLRSRLVRAGRARVARYTWEGTAAGLAGLYRDARAARR